MLHEGLGPIVVEEGPMMALVPSDGGGGTLGKNGSISLHQALSSASWRARRPEAKRQRHRHIGYRLAQRPATHV